MRRGIPSSDGHPRGIVEGPQPSPLNQSQAGPRYHFNGVDPNTGYANYELTGELAKVVYPLINEVPLTAIASQGEATYLDEPAYTVELVAPALGSVVDYYVQNDAELLDGSSTVIASLRILHHTDKKLWLSTETGLLPAGAVRVQLRSRLFQVITDGVEGLGSTYPGSQSGTRVPNANVRIGFAFHQDPANSAASRYPVANGDYVYDLSDPAVQEAIRQLGAAYVQYDVIFDGSFKSVPTDEPPDLSPLVPRPELHYLRLPYRF